MRTDTDSERQFATDLGYMQGNGPEIRHHLFSMAQEIDQLRLALAAEREAARHRYRMETGDCAS